MFFLNETHELSPVDKKGGGRLPDYANVNWGQRSAQLSSTIGKTIAAVEKSHDPLKEKHYFVVAAPVEEIEKRSKDKKKAPQGTFKDRTAFGGGHGRIFDRLGLDLLQVTDEGQALVHASRERMNQLFERTKSLEHLGAREQSRWMTIDSFATAPLDFRVDGEWLNSLKPNQAADVVFELQPVLGRVDGDRVLRAIADVLARGSDERLTGSGSDFSGRYWFRGKASRTSIREIARDFFSVQAIHSPLYSFAAATRKSAGRAAPARAVPRAQTPSSPENLPCVAVVDLGVPTDHVYLRDYCRGRFVPQGTSLGAPGDHGSFVASRVVFGKCDSANQLEEATPGCSYYDAVVWDNYENRVGDKIVMDAMRGVRGAAPDVRVFNLSFGDERALASFADVEQREKRLLMQDLDNFIFANDVIVVVAAGNSAKGVVPATPYPNHHDDPRWALGPWACGFNSLVCGSYVGTLSPDGLVSTVGWPSPFTRVGPGLCAAPVPTFAAEGGNGDGDYNFKPGMGVWGISGDGMPEDRVGTSFAAPLLARDCAIALNTLQQYCATGTKPYGVAVRAFLALTAEPTTSDAAVAALAERTLGFGRASAVRLEQPNRGSAVFLWQGTIENTKSKVRVQLPIPRGWLGDAGEPYLRLVVAYDPPVNAAANELWACRKVSAVLHSSPDSAGIRGAQHRHETYPLFVREYKLSSYAPNSERAAPADEWLLELGYDEIFDYPPGMEFSPLQRVAFAAELVDRSESPVDPQAAVQSLPNVQTMNRLSIESTAIRTPVIIRSRA